MDRTMLTIIICTTLLAACAQSNLVGDAGRPQGASVQDVLDVLSQAKNVNPCERQGSGCGPFLAKDMTADEYCRQEGYRACLSVQNGFNTVYFPSEDGTCEGTHRYVDSRLQINGPANCHTRFDDFFINLYGLTPTDGIVECQQGGYSQSDHWSTYSVSFICA